MNAKIKQKILTVCANKIQQKGEGVQLSFYAFFANKNTDPVALMQVARWWIEENQFDHFEKATKIQALIEAMDQNEVV
ncbi:hypothetical protein J9B83_12795 [Marinomonas sp. A79]|uniref:Msl2237 protein n=2 Tax=Marinomonas vulgaris TaxID=2823372 RepID=A0ABS5HDU2_9GAMM|nr:hypothetical protein [Marinomonas vulgaris]